MTAGSAAGTPGTPAAVADRGRLPGDRHEEHDARRHRRSGRHRRGGRAHRLPRRRPGQLPDAVALADEGDWRAALAGAVLMAPPLRAPLLYTANGEIPSATGDALKALRPGGSTRANGAQAIRLATAAGPEGLRVTSLPGADPYTLARNIDDYRSRVAGRPSAAVVVVPADAPQFAMPAAAWAAKSGDPVLFTARDRLPAPTAAAIRAHGRPRIYLLGPPSVVSAGVEGELSRLGTVTRIAEADAPRTAVAFARFQDGAFGWGIVDPGHGFVFANPGRPGDAGAAAPLSASGMYGPLLITAPGGLAARRGRRVPARRAAGLLQRSGARRLQSRLDRRRPAGGGRRGAGHDRRPARDRPRQSQEAVSEAENPTRSSAPPGHGRGRPRALRRLHTALRAADPQPHRPPDRGPAGRQPGAARWASRRCSG